MPSSIANGNCRPTVRIWLAGCFTINRQTNYLISEPFVPEWLILGCEVKMSVAMLFSWPFPQTHLKLRYHIMFPVSRDVRILCKVHFLQVWLMIAACHLWISHQVVRLSLPFYSLSAAYLYIYDGPDYNSEVLVLLTPNSHTHYPSRTIFSSTQQYMFVRFLSYDDTGYKGFTASFVSNRSACKCDSFM